MQSLYPPESQWLQDEIWVPLITPYYDYTGLYSISNLGRVWTVEIELLKRILI